MESGTAALCQHTVYEPAMDLAGFVVQASDGRLGHIESEGQAQGEGQARGEGLAQGVGLARGEGQARGGGQARGEGRLQGEDRIEGERWIDGGPGREGARGAGRARGARRLLLPVGSIVSIDLTDRVVHLDRTREQILRARTPADMPCYQLREG